jgi:hypothetical protein
MSGVELIAAALAAGVTAGISGTASEAVRDVYLALKRMLADTLADRDDARPRLDAQDTEPAAWQIRLGDDLAACGADTDERILALARRLLSLTDPVGQQPGASNVGFGDNFGAVGIFNAPVSINHPATTPAASGKAR